MSRLPGRDALEAELDTSQSGTPLEPKGSLGSSADRRTEAAADPGGADPRPVRPEIGSTHSEKPLSEKHSE